MWAARRRVSAMRIYTDYWITYEDRERATEGWFADPQSYEDFRAAHPDADALGYLEEVGAFAAPLLEEGWWYLPKGAALSIAAIRMMEEVGWLPPHSFREELVRELDHVELLDYEPQTGALRLIYTDEADEDEDEEEE
jgi:hypothetical protein